MIHRGVFAVWLFWYWVMEGGEVEIVVVWVVESAVSALLVSWVGHFLQFLQVKHCDRHPKHGHCPYCCDDGAEDIGLNALVVGDWHHLEVGDCFVGPVDPQELLFLLD